MNTSADTYFTDGCGRCPLGGTADCKVHSWTKELQYLRNLVLECGLTETCKWGVPCYTHQGQNIAIVAAFRDHCALSFFKGALLGDPDGILEQPGANTQGARVVKFTGLEKIIRLESVLKSCIFEAIEVERAGLKVDFKEKEALVYPEELEARFAGDPDLQAAFEALTPGRKRGYILHFSSAKQSKTREARIEKYVPNILAGKGWNE